MKITKCQKCGQVKDWVGDDIRCPYQGSLVVNFDNWNCGVIRKIRNLCEIAKKGEDNRLHYQYCDDEHYVVIRTAEIQFKENTNLCLVVIWYKDRGRTDNMWMIDNGATPRIPELWELEAIIEHFGSKFDLNN